MFEPSQDIGRGVIRHSYITGDGRASTYQVLPSTLRVRYFQLFHIICSSSVYITHIPVVFHILINSRYFTTDMFVKVITKNILLRLATDYQAQCSKISDVFHFMPKHGRK